ncbi:Aste57867_11372 [Aphanomyces stellatus]|uniref:Aste57867_11372 protein n=1 Tax=Aphanomyces stellatus TaxID=120398 RepID=A0A485KSW5_9STRA|nr:hypothetical protein As57867_011330 [Aphanomyces stellatus]VFT88234.1 Aste57867_11372 [Aphanomyces stellatus]
MAKSQVVLLDSDLVRLICAFQLGLPQDLIAIRRISQCHSTDEEICQVLSPWFDLNGLSRLHLAVASVPIADTVIMQFAAREGRVDILQLLHDRYINLNSTDQLFQVAAVHGRVAVFEYLHEIGYRLDGLEHAIVAAVNAAQISILQYVLETYAGCQDMTEWISAGHAASCVEYETLGMLHWILTVWFPAMNPKSVASTLRQCLECIAVHRGSNIDKAVWCAKQLQSSDPTGILEAFLSFESMEPLLEYLDEDMDVSVETLSSLVSDERVGRFDVVFAKLTCLQDGGSKRRDSARQCLMEATKHCHLVMMQWLVKSLAMESTDIDAVLHSTTCGEYIRPYHSLREYDVDIVAAFIETHNIGFHRSFMLTVVCWHLERVRAVDLAAMKAMKVTSFATYCVAKFIRLMEEEEGGEGALLGRCIQHMVRSTHSRWDKAVLKKVYKSWDASIEDETAKSMKRKIESDMVDELIGENLTESSVVKWFMQQTSIKEIQRGRDAAASTARQANRQYERRERRRSARQQI